MRMLKLVLVSMLLPFMAEASEVYDCSAQLPKGQAQILVQDGIGVGGELKLVFKNLGQNQFYVGKLKVISLSDEGFFLAQGFVATYGRRSVIRVVISGSQVAAEDGSISLQLHAAGDRRLEFGFGNLLSCLPR